MKSLQTPLSKKAVSSTDLSSLFQRLLTTRPEFDTKSLREQNCWPITGRHYKEFTVQKRNGSTRRLVTVDKRLKSIQRNLQQYLEQNFEVSQYAYGFIGEATQSHKGRQDLRARGVVSNALAHTNKKVVISIDLEDFFPSITFPRVLGLLKSQPYSFSNKQAAVLASLICLPKSIDDKRGLPQGAPTSPLISNLICKKLDYQVGLLAKKYDLVYTRYADDLTISTNNVNKVPPIKILSLVKSCIERNGFKVNSKKTKVMYPNQRQMVTGLVVNEGLNLPKKQVSSLKATLHNLEFKYKNVDDAVKDSNKNNYDSFNPVGYYSGLHRGRYIKSVAKGRKSTKPTSEKEFNYIYSRHILGRVLWYGQVVTTGINTPYDLSKRQHISPKQYVRIIKFEEMLSSLYRISIKYDWSIEHIILRFSNKLSHLKSSLRLMPNYSLNTIEPPQEEVELKERLLNLKNTQEERKKFFDNAPTSLQRTLTVDNKSRKEISFVSIKNRIDNGWYKPDFQQELFKELDHGRLSDLFHRSSNDKGHSVQELLVEIVNVVRPRLRYLSKEMRERIVTVHRELLKLMLSEGEGAYIEYGKDSSAKPIIQAISSLKLATRLYEDDTDNFYNKIVLDAVKQSGTENYINIDRSDMELRLVTDIKAWRDSLVHILFSIKQHLDKTELDIDSLSHKPYTIVFRDENPISSEPRAVEIYRSNESLPYKKKLEIPLNSDSGFLDKWVTGRDLLLAIEKFMSVGDVFVHGNFKDCDKYKVNLTEHSYIKEDNATSKVYGKLFFTLQENK
ncbi:reverse transcriptase family protein [Vibrio fluvialis]|nr:RNA-directed DNA polymerase [Vibrio fluvialis]EKO3473044.1 RNA-directed DNA polymerase [Vibrio fluvialis]MBY8115744.1 reverse transcriptase family protein [Vibrio fluvialis]MBY8248517.1 reverse transcriptase family protein [Vibrio fluvialis]MBY8282505.1 reverse transcriptase family protein [Vibrio fluvialis]